MKKTILISIFVFGLGGMVLGQMEKKVNSEIVPVPLSQSAIENLSQSKTKEIEIDLREAEKLKKPIKGCKNFCGDGICQEIVCLAVGCPCSETSETCPQDCKKEKRAGALPVLPVLKLPSETKIEIDPTVEKPVLIEDKVLEVKGLEKKEMPKISVEVQTPSIKETTIQIEIDKEKKLTKIEHENVTALTQEPIKVEEKLLKIQTQKGEISVNVLPSTALQIVVQNQPQKIEDISLKVKNDLPIYETKGRKEEKFLRIFPVNIPFQSSLDAQTGRIIKISQPLWAKILDIFSF